MPDAVEVLKRVPLFAALSERQLRKLSSKLKNRQFSPGTAVVREGSMGGVGFFILVSGDATVSEDGRDVAKLGPGDHFGELGLIAGRERTATVTADATLDCLEMPVWDFRELVERDGELGWKLLQHVTTVLLDGHSAASAVPS
ncbi:MAG TPA: cyclic nucleotide-binding domain-containing protein [Gaiellaceae bacterium]